MKNLVINGTGGWQWVFRKQPNRPVEVLKRHVELGDHGGWVLAKKCYLKALIDKDELAGYFGLETL